MRAEERIGLWRTLIGQLPVGSLVVETGRIRKYGHVDGYSTKWLAEAGNVGRVFSIDNNPDTEEFCRINIAHDCISKIVFINKDSVLGLRALNIVLPPQSLSFVLLDSANVAILTLQEFLAIMSTIRDGAIIVIDNAVGENQKKGELLLPFLKQIGQDVEYIGECAVIKHYKVVDENSLC